MLMKRNGIWDRTALAAPFLFVRRELRMNPIRRPGVKLWTWHDFGRNQKENWGFVLDSKVQELLHLEQKPGRSGSCWEWYFWHCAVANWEVRNGWDQQIAKKLNPAIQLTSDPNIEFVQRNRWKVLKSGRLSSKIMLLSPLRWSASRLKELIK